MHELRKQNNDPEEGIHPPPPRISSVTILFASGLYSGFLPFASGTAGTFVGLIVYFLPSFEQITILLPASVIVLLLGVIASSRMEEVYGHDPSVVTIDEVLGMWVSLLFLPKGIGIAFAAFLIFRAMDVLKPWPASAFDKMPGGWGVMLDDVVAGMYTNILIHLGMFLYER